MSWQRCEGTGTKPAGGWTTARCPVCGRWITLTPRGALTAHTRPPEAS